jgi:alanine racemase
MKTLVRPGVKIAAVIKANAYGHGQNEVAKILEKEADYFQVDDIEELRLLRKVSKKETFVFGYVPRKEMAEVIELGGILCAYDRDQILAIDRAAKKLGKKAKVHLKIDASLGRQGILIENLEEMVNEIKSCKNIIVDGVYSHFANIEDTTDFSHAAKQLNLFGKAVSICEKSGLCRLKTHISASSGILAYEKNGGKSLIVRPGIMLYGMWPSEDLKRKFEKNNFKLKPVLRWVTHVAQVKAVPANFSIGYGLTYITKKPTKIAIIPQGYSDGYDRGFSNKGKVLIKGKKCNVLGRVAMNMFAVDVSHIQNVELEDEAVLLGCQGKQNISAESMALMLETINYEITARISPLIPRIIS